MAKLSMKLKQQAEPKFSTRRYNRCKICGRPHAYLRDYGICRICFPNHPAGVSIQSRLRLFAGDSIPSQRQ